MTPPSFKTRLLGHAVVVWPMTAASLWSLYEVYAFHGDWPITVAILVMMHFVMKANEQVAAYRAWKRAWDSMAEPEPPRARRPRRAIVLALIVILAGYLAMTPQQPDHTLALGWMMLAALLAAIVVMMRWLWARRRRVRPNAPAANPVASICVTQPLAPVPSLEQAQAMLPEYCQRIFTGSPS